MTAMRGFVLLTTAAVLCGSVTEASAQERFQFGGKVGPSFANIVLDEDDGGDYHQRIAAGGGGFFALSLAGPLGVQLEALSMPKGSRLETSDTTQTLKLRYFEVPVLLRLDAPGDGPGGWYLFGGGFFAIRTGAQAQISIVANSISSGTREDAGEFIERFENGWTAGAGLNIGRYILVEGRYSRGLSNVNKVADSPRFVNHGLTFLIGVRN
jgi:hypothetical protein